MCIEKSLFALSSFQLCPLSQVKYLSNISEYKSSLLESWEGYSSSAPYGVCGLDEQKCVYMKGDVW